jgi:hypothetical protein
VSIEVRAHAMQIGLTDADTPSVFRAGDYTHVLMPLRLE